MQDFGEVLCRVLEAPIDKVGFEVFNAGSDSNNYTKKMIVDAIIKEAPHGKVRYQEIGEDPRNYRVDFSKIKDELLFEPRLNVVDGIQELITAMKNGFFLKIDQEQIFYGNWDINYSFRA